MAKAIKASDFDPKVIAERSHVYGHVEGIPVGKRFDTRADCWKAGLHGTRQAGIHGSSTEGAYSVVLSKGYDDDKDEGDIVYYTGSGGINPDQGQSAKKIVQPQGWFPDQNRDQEFVRGNQALEVSKLTQKPIRLIRGSEGHLKYSPPHGFRYDGLYRVVDSWKQKGRSGFEVCMFKFERLGGQPPLPITSPAMRSIMKPKRKQTKPKATPTTYAPVKVDTSRAGIRLRERQAEIEKARAQVQQRKLKRKAESETEEEEEADTEEEEEGNSKPRPSNKVMAGRLAKRSKPMPSSSLEPELVISTNVPSASKPLPARPGVKRPMRTRSSNSFITSPTSPKNNTAFTDLGAIARRKRLKAALTDDLPEKMQQLAMPNECR